MPKVRHSISLVGMRVRYGAVLLVVLSSIGLNVEIANSLAVINQIVISQVDVNQFPFLTVHVRVTGEGGSPVADVDVSDLEVLEDKQPVDFSLHESRVGVRVALIFDAGGGVTRTGATGLRRFDEMKAVAIGFLDGLDPKDTVQVILVNREGVSTLQAFTSDKGALKALVSDLDPGDTTDLSYGLDAVERALKDLKGATATPAKSEILLLSTGIQVVHLSGTTVDSAFREVEKTARDAHVPIQAVLFNDRFIPSNLDRLAANTAGTMVYYTSEETTQALYSLIEANRTEYLITYRTKSGSGSLRTVTVSARILGSSVPHADFGFTVQPIPQPPQVKSMEVNGGQSLVREAPRAGADPNDIQPKDFKVVPILDWPDGYPRDLAWAQLIVDGNPIGSRVVDAEASPAFSWDLRGYSTIGDHTAKLQVQLQDELGFTTTSNPEAVTVSVITSCGKATGFNGFLCSLKSNLGSVAGVVALILVLPTLALAAVSLRYRQQIGGAVGDMRERIVAYITTSRLKKLKPKAYLYPRMGVGGASGPFAIYGTTQIGRDPGKVGGPGGILIVQNTQEPMVSGLHCTITDEGDNAFRIRDEGSSNGTFLVASGERVAVDDMDGRDLHDGDIIELAEVEHGGARLEFHLPGEDGGPPLEFSHHDVGTDEGNPTSRVPRN